MKRVRKSVAATIVGGIMATAVPASAGVSGANIANIALANVGKQACSTNSEGGSDFDSSCTGNGGQPEYWCADFARWVWAAAGVDASTLDAAAGSFYVYGQDNGTLHDSPTLGDAVVFDWQGGGVADHVAVVTQVNSDGTIETVSGDWGGTGSTEAGFASTSSVVLNSPAYASTVGTEPTIMGMTVSGFVTPVGETAAAPPPYAATFVGQSFPLASTALTLFAGQTIASYIEMKNAGAKTWDKDTRLGTTEPRDRASAFADSTWLSTSRAAAVTGSVAPGDSYKFTFDLHAPSTLGTYLEYWNLVEDGVAWFSDPGEGGPVDNDLEANIVVVAGVRGNLDSASCSAIAGWTQDQASPDTAIDVDLYFDAPVGSTGSGSMRVAAGSSRSDLCTAIGSCDHGFSVPVPGALCDGSGHKVYAYGIASSGAGPNELLGSSPRSFTCQTPAAPLTPKAGVKRHVVDQTSFAAWKFTSLEVVGEPDAVVAAYPTASPLPSTPTVVIATGAPEVWVIDGNVRRHVIDPASLADWQFTVATWTATNVDAYAQGADWPTTVFLMQGTGETEVYVLDTAPSTPPVDAGVFDAGVVGKVIDAGSLGRPASRDATVSTADATVSPPGSSGGCTMAPTAAARHELGWWLTGGIVGCVLRKRSRSRTSRTAT
jgi:hypothetical protein